MARVVPTLKGLGVVQVMRVTYDHRGQDSSSSNTCHSCPGVMDRSTELVDRKRAVSMSSNPTGSQGNIWGTGGL
jgi:hypothetical protein